MRAAPRPPAEPIRLPSPPDVFRQAMVGAPCARPQRVLSRSSSPRWRSCDGLFRRLGYERIERPVAGVERAVKGLLFDCKMCGQCVLSSTGMSCPMNCPKSLRNGPCGGVRANGHCEVKPEMRCVWVRGLSGQPAHTGSGVAAMGKVQVAVDQRQKGRSSWLRVVRELAAASAPPGDVPRSARHEIRRRAGAGLSAADPAGSHLAGTLRAGAARGRIRASPPSSRRPIPPIRRMSTSARGCSTATSMRSTPPTAAARTATCRASPFARC